MTARPTAPSPGAGTYQTGGIGGALTGSVVDHLASQGSLIYDGAQRLLYAVNAGSNTISVFAVHGDRLDRTQVISSGGTFPVSIAVHGNLVYVLNALDGGSIQGYVRVGKRLDSIASWNRDLGLDPAATPQFTHTPGQIAFTPDGTKLLVTTKANTNSIDVFTLGRFGEPSLTPVVNAEPGAVPFAVAFDTGGNVAVAEAGTNAVATFTLGGDGRLDPIQVAATGQAATCWILGTGHSLYASNAGSASLSGYEDAGQGLLTAAPTTATDAGTVDAAASSTGGFVYVQTGAAGIVDEFKSNADGSLTAVGSVTVTVPGVAGGEGIAAS